MNNCFHNIEQIKKLNKGKKIIAVVKANAYGHGIRGFCNILEKYKKIDYFAVATLDEAVNLRLNGITSEILVLGVTGVEYFDTAFEYNVCITCYNLKTAKNIKNYNKKLKVHIKIDTGMNRIGFNTLEEYKEVVNYIDNSESEIVGLFTHFSSADSDEQYTLNQIEKFKAFYNYTKDRDIEVHIQNSAGIINNCDIDFVTAIRPGLAMYGHNCTNKKLDLKPLISLKSKVTMLKSVGRNSKIGYNGEYITREDIKLATLPIGYADGYKMVYKSLYAVKDKEKYSIRGKICMDQTMVEVDEKVKEGDFLYLINDDITAEYIVKKTDISIYEFLTSWSNRIYREFYVNDEIVAKENIMYFDMN